MLFRKLLLLKPSSKKHSQSDPITFSFLFPFRVDFPVSFSFHIVYFSSFYSLLLGQIDPSEKLDPEVEDILMDIADDFVESVSDQTNILFSFSFALWNLWSKIQNFVAGELVLVLC